MKILLNLSFFVTSLFFVNNAFAAHCADGFRCTTKKYTVEISQTQTADVEVLCHERTTPVRAPAEGEFYPGSILAVHGMVHNASFFDPLSPVVLNQYPNVNQFCALTLPGHVAAGNVSGKYYLADYAKAVQQTIIALNNDRYDVRTLIGHSMGGLVIQLAEDQLLAKGLHLSDAPYGIKNIALLAPSMPADVSWSAVALLAAKLPGYITVDPVLHPVVALPDADFLGFFYFNGLMVVKGAPDFFTVVPKINSLEPLSAAAQLGGVGLPRPNVTKFLLNTYRVVVIGYNADPYATPTELKDLVNHIAPRANLQQVSVTGPSGEEAVHGAAYSHPQSTSDALVKILR